MSQDSLDEIEHIKANHQAIKSNIESSIEMGFCAVNQTKSRLYYLENPNPYQCEYFFQSEMLQIQPSQGYIPAKGRVSFTLNYTPTEATAFVCTIIMNIQHEEPRIIKASAIGKYPFIQLNTQKINFESILIGKQIVKDLTIKNSSNVPAQFNIVKMQDDEYKDNSITLDIYQGEIPPKSSFLIQATYLPSIVGLISVIHYKIVCVGGNELVFSCTGEAVGFDVELSAQSVNFGEVKIGKEVSRLVNILNKSDLPTTYQFTNDSGNIFGINQIRGTIKPKQNARVIITFKPTHTICYYERVYCIIRNHKLFYIDLIGTCYDLLIKPIPLQQKHIDAFRRRVIQGKLSEIDFKYMENAFLLKQSNLQNPSVSMKSGIQGLQQSITQNNFSKNNNQNENNLNSIVDEETNESINQVVLHKEMFLPSNSKQKLIYLSEDFLDFGFQQFMAESPAFQVELTNKLQCKITIFWTIQNKETINNELLPVFIVRPSTVSMKANSTQIFEISFRPIKNSFYYFQNLQFFAFKYNSKVTKQLIEDMKKNPSKTIQGSFRGLENLKLTNTMNSNNIENNLLSQQNETIPPYSSSIKCVGHSFGLACQPFIPILQFKPSNKITFNTCSIQESLYQSIELVNQSDTPTYFKFLPDLTKTYRVYPNVGIVESKSFVVITIEFVPTEYKAYNNTLSCYLNHNASNVSNLHVHAYCSKPKLALQNEGKVYFPPQYTGVYSRQKVKIDNLSRVPLEYKIEVPEKYQCELYLEPSEGKIKPNEHIFIDCSFIPYKKKNYKIKVPLHAQEIMDFSQNLIGYYLPGSGNPENQLRMRSPMQVMYNFEIFGAGGDGSLSILPAKIDFDVIKVGFRDKKYATLQNFSNCTFYVELKLRHENLKDENQKTDDFDKNFSLDFKSGILAANSKVDIGIIFNPTQVADYNLVLDVVAQEKNPKRATTAVNKRLLSQKCSLKIHAKGSYPQLKIVDVRNDAISVANLWENFQINKINKELLSELNEDEKQYLDIEQLNYEQAQQLQKRIQSYEWNFGYLPANKNANKQRKIVVTVQNVGGTDVDYNFKLPSDNQIQVEPWADPGEPDEEEAFEKTIIERKIFQIRPKSGTLKKGELKDIELIYNPSNGEDQEQFIKQKPKQNIHGEKHSLRAVLQILNGKPLQINLKGMALAPLEGLLAVKKDSFELPNVPLGLLMPVKVPIEVQNVGSSKVSYKIETYQSDDGENYSHNQNLNVFCLEKDSEQLLPNEKQYLYCLFKPLVSKVYYFKLKIIVYDFVKISQELYINIKGQGYDLKKPLKVKNEDEIPRQRSNNISALGSKAFFSIEELDFGIMNVGKTEYRLIILYNLNQNTRFSFDFGSSSFALSNNKPGLMCGDECTIEPITGNLEPSSFLELKVGLTCGLEPSVYQGELECNIVWDNKDASNVLEKETLFLRVKKSSNLNQEVVNSQKLIGKKEEGITHLKSLFTHPFEFLIERTVQNILNDTFIDGNMLKIDKQPNALYNSFDEQKSIDILQVSKVQDNLLDEEEENEDEKLTIANDYRVLFLQNQFISLVDLIFENTFFNIIQETTRKECDLLKISKTFVMKN